MKDNGTGTAEAGKGIWGLIDRIQGDKVVWMILILLILFSIVSIFSSTSLLVSGDPGDSRLEIFFGQLVTVLGGIILIFLCYKNPFIKLFRVLSQFGYALSMGLLLCLIFDIRAVEVNGARRAIDLGFFQVHVYEVVKVAMIMYLAWAAHAYQTDSFGIAGRLSRKFKGLAFLARPGWKLWIYIFIPIITVCIGIFAGSASSTLFIGGIMVLTILIGGVRFRDIMKLLPLMVAGLVICISIWAISDGRIFSRVGTALSRIGLEHIVENVTGEPVISVKTYDADNIFELTPGTQEFQDALDAIRQPESAKIAIHEGGLIGKLPGNSTQKYTVSLIFSDYMFSFIAEEYGFIGATLIIMLYISLLARGALIVRYCDSIFSKTAVAGLTVLITGQALMHIFINLDMGLLTGQTLPMVSHGKSSFLCFSIAFGIILSISKMVKANIQKETDESEPLVEGMDVDENVGESLRDLEDFESGI